MCKQSPARGSEGARGCQRARQVTGGGRLPCGTARMCGAVCVAPKQPARSSALGGPRGGLAPATRPPPCASRVQSRPETPETPRKRGVSAPSSAQNPPMRQHAVHKRVPPAGAHDGSPGAPCRALHVHVSRRGAPRGWCVMLASTQAGPRGASGAPQRSPRGGGKGMRTEAGAAAACPFRADWPRGLTLAPAENPALRFVVLPMGAVG